MLPFCGYNMADYFKHWLSVGGMTDSEKLPKIYKVNWFRKGADGAFLWPGFGENARVLKWIVERLEGKAEAQTTAIGLLPTKASLDVSGLTLRSDALDTLLSVDAAAWAEEAALIPDFYGRYGDRLPQPLWLQHAALVQRLEALDGAGAPAPARASA
jgi:phosphoenolpyruvate carboxykinase (GTP)